MKELVNSQHGKKHPKIRQLANDLTRDLPQKAWKSEVKRIFDFVQNDIRYLRDTRGTETLQYPYVVLENGQGDCDDKVVLLASLLESIGHPTRFKAVGFKPGKLSHVYVETRVGTKNGNKWLALETTEPVEMGWRPPRAVNSLVVHN